MLIGAGVGVLIVAVLAVGFLFPLQVFNALVPKDAGGRVLMRGVAFGAEPRQRLDVYVPTEVTPTRDAARRDPGVDARGQAPRVEARAQALPLSGGGGNGNDPPANGASSPQPAGPRPILVYLYGGSWANGTRRGYDFVGRAFAAAGFVTIVPDYRLYPDVRYPSFLEDCAAAVAWARAHAAEIGGDPDRILLVGHSAGAYNVAMLALDPRWLAAAGVPCSAIVAWAGLAGPYDFLPLAVAATQRTFGEADDLPDTQPVNHVDPGDPPALVATGDLDRTVAPRHTMTLAALMRETGIAAEAKIYNDVGHLGIAAAIARPLRGRAPVLADIVAFLRARLDEAG